MNAAAAATDADGRRVGGAYGKISTIGCCVVPGIVIDVSMRRVGRVGECKYECGCGDGY
jgi:hypothetical protein